MWVKVEYFDDAQLVVFGQLDNEPVVYTNRRLGMDLAVSYDQIREHMKAESFKQ